MFDVGWQEILVVGVVALLVVGPKELPTLLRTIGKYVGVVKRQAAEFRAQFDEAMRETEFEQLKKDVEKLKSDTESSLREVQSTVDSEISSVRKELDETTQAIGSTTPHPDAHDANGVPLVTDDTSRQPPPAPPRSAGAAAIAAAEAAAPPPGAAAPKVDA